MNLTCNGTASIGLGLAAVGLMATLLVAPGAVADAPSAPAPAAAAAATVRILGPGSQPGLAVDAAGTAYVAWNGPENPSTLRFCRLPRGAAACSTGHARTIATQGNSLTRPFVVVSGSRVVVVSYRYPLSGSLTPGSYRYTSSNGGSTFSAGVRVGSVPFFEAVHGPGDTLSGVTDALSTGMVYQNVPLGGDSAGDTAAVLSAPGDSPYRGGVGLVDAGTPLAVFTAGDDAAKFRRYDGSGSLNNVANWTPAVGIGYAAYPKLAGGFRGLWLVAGNPAGRMFVRKYTGTGFGAALSLGVGNAPNQHVVQDAAGRLHSVVQRGDANGLHLIHWVSDVDGEWRSETLASQNPGTAGAFNSPRVATAADHIGFAVWQASTAGNIRIVPVGPDVPKPRPRLTLSGGAKHVKNKVLVKARGKLVPPAGVAAPNACKGDVKVTIKKGSKVLASKSDAVNGQCRFSVRKSLREGKVGDARKLKLVARFSGSRALAPTTTSRKVRVRG